MIGPPYLKKGATVAITATARKPDQKAIAAATDLLTNWGLKVRLGTHLFSEERQFAGTDSQRAADMQGFLDDPEIKAIWCARGGYGTVRICHLLDFSLFKKHPKWVIGYSDITVLHSCIHNLGFQTLHATIPTDIVNNSGETIASLRKVLFGKKITYRCKANPLNRKGMAKGILTGGNLSVLYSLTGSPFAVNMHGKILFLEDVDEYLYHVDRMIINLKHNGWFKNLQAIIVGGMTKMHDNMIPFGKTPQEIILEHTADYNFPICFDFPAGHLKTNKSIIFGNKITLSIDHDSFVSFSQ